MKPKVFFFHYNKPASAAAGCPKLSVHYNKVCHIVDHVCCFVAISSHHQKRQPRCIMKGKARFVDIKTMPNGEVKAFIS